MGQIELVHSTTKVYYHNQVLTHAFAGGINSAQIGELDINLDELVDLVILDRASDKITCFVNTGQSYIYSQNYDLLFPNDLEKWMVLADYDCDGKNDIFTYSNLGIRVFHNKSETELLWEKVKDPLLTMAGSNNINIALNATDIPAIVDMDLDGDLDILHYNFANGDLIEYHENQSVEQNNSCGLIYQRSSTRYGDLETCGCGEFAFDGASCHSSARLNHVVGKTLLAFDADADSDMDLVVSQDECDHMNLLENTGDAKNPIFNQSTIDFPNEQSPIDWLGFPTAFFMDVTFDGKKDLVFSQNLRENPSTVNLAQSCFVSANIGAGEFSVSQPFLQNQMIDVGEFSYPALGDVDGDGLEDLLIGNGGWPVGNKLIGKIAWYKFSEKGLTFQTEDAFLFSTLGYHRIRPQLIDLDKDGQLDLAFQAIDHTNNRVFGYLINKSQATGLDFDISKVIYMDFPISSDSDYLIYDWDQDGRYDLLEATFFGELHFYQGSEDFSSFVLQETDLLNATTDLDEYNLSISIFDIDQDGTDDLITTRRPGVLKVYTDIRNNKTEFKSQLFKIENSDVLQEGRFGKYAKPVGGLLGGKPVLVVGGIQGGIQLFDSKRANNSEKLKMDVYPNPSLTNIFTIETNQVGLSIEVVDLFGKLHFQSDLPESAKTIKVDLSNLQRGIYLIRLFSRSKYVTKKVIIS